MPRRSPVRPPDSRPAEPFAGDGGADDCVNDERALRARRHAALGDPRRLEIIDLLTTSDRSPGELDSLLGVGSNLLAHHLDALEAVGLVCRTRSSGDGRRRYVHLCAEALSDLLPPGPPPAAGAAGRTVFVCTANSARSQLAAAIHSGRTGRPALSAGTRPAAEVHPGARAAARRLGLDLDHVTPRHLDEILGDVDAVITVCDRAHETIRLPDRWQRATRLHWSIPDPVADGRNSAFDDVARELERRMTRVVPELIDGGPRV